MQINQAKKFFSDSKLRYHFKNHVANVHKKDSSFVSKCFSKKLLPINLLKFFQGNSFFLEDYAIESQYIDALAPAFEDKQNFDLIQLKNNELDDVSVEKIL